MRQLAGVSALVAAIVALPLVQCGGMIDTGEPEVQILGRVTGPLAAMTACPPELQVPSPDDTSDRWGVGGTDLGVSWDTGRGEVAIAFGDTFANPDHSGDWRHNVLAFSSDRDPSDGITISRMVSDRPGHASEIVGATPGIVHEGIIPTSGIAVGQRNYLFFMSVAHWGLHGVWTTNYSSFATSDDGGETWARSGVTWPGDSVFAQVGLALDGGYLYALGTPSGRLGAARIMRVDPTNVLASDRYEYFDGAGHWVAGQEAAAAPVFPAPVGELSLHFNAFRRLWQVTYLNQISGHIVMRTAPALTGPWSDEILLVDRFSPNLPMVYGGFQHPWFNDGPDVYLTISKITCYEAFFARVVFPPPK